MHLKCTVTPEMHRILRFFLKFLFSVTLYFSKMLRQLVSPIYLSHDDVDAAYDGGYVGDETTASNLVGDA